MQDKVYILTDAGKDFGYGHLMRCLAIAQGFKEKGIDSVFYLRGDSDPSMIIKDFSWEKKDWIFEKLDTSGKIVILDSYYADENYCKNIYNNSKKVLFIDDYNRINYPGGYVLNSVIGANEIDYPINPEINYLLGPQYHPLRKEFWKVPVKVIKGKVEKILITFGGTDLTNETPHILNYLNKNYPELEKHVIIGNGFSNIEEMKDISDKKTILIDQPEAVRMKYEMLECDIAISAAGQTIYELARVGIPSLLKKIADNQENNIKFWERERCFMRVNDISDIDVLANSNAEFRKRFQLLMTGIIDGKGIFRIINSLVESRAL